MNTCCDLFVICRRATCKRSHLDLEQWLTTNKRPYPLINDDPQRSFTNKFGD